MASASPGIGRKIVFLTGGTGNMGAECIRHILQLPDPVELRVLVRPQERALPQVKRMLRERRLNVVWGDLADLASLAEGIRGADVVLHVGGLVSPLADYLPPEVVERVNVQGAANIVEAIRRVADPERTRLVYIGTVAQTGSRNTPIHWGRTGDPIKISAFDHYAASKTRAEMLIAESGLRYWVSLRQSGMAHCNMWKQLDPIMFHNVLDGVFEWSTASDSGRLMANMCGDDVPDSLWRRFFNIGGGERSRITNRELFELTMGAMGVKDFRDVIEPHWFATQNFHGQWYSDSDLLEELVPFREQSIGEFFDALAQQIPWYIGLAGRLAPGAVRKRLQGLAEGEHGSLYWISRTDDARINAHFGARAGWERIPRDWDSYEFADPSRIPVDLDHGYDESVPADHWSAADLVQAAQFRGGCCDAASIDGPYKQVDWRCAQGHAFTLSPNTVLKGGHWCPQCSCDPDTYEQQSRNNPFFAQVWTQEAAG